MRISDWSSDVCSSDLLSDSFMASPEHGPGWTLARWRNEGNHVRSSALPTGGGNGATNHSPDGNGSPLLPVACLEDTRRRILLQQGDEERVVTLRVPPGVAWQPGRRGRHAAVRGSEDTIEARDRVIARQRRESGQ